MLAKIVNILQLNDANDMLKILTMRNYLKTDHKALTNQILNFDRSSYGSDIYFFARKNGKLISSRLVYQLLYANLNQLETINNKYGNVLLLFDTCASKPSTFCPTRTFCKQNFITSTDSLTVDANATSFVGMNNVLSTECYCNLESTQQMCYNGGTLVASNGGSDYYCKCLNGYDGPRCEFLSITFNHVPSSPSHSYAMFKSIELCDPSRIEFEFTTERTKGLLLFNGPLNRESTYFFAVEITNSTLLVHIGSTLVSFSQVNVSDKSWHKVDILLSENVVQVILDKCYSKIENISNYEDMTRDKLTIDEIRLSLGGIPPKVSQNHYYYKVLNVFEYEGCLRNLKVNGELRDLKLKQNEFNLAQNAQQCDCNYLAKCDSKNEPIVRSHEFPWWIILIILGALLILGKYFFILHLLLKIILNFDWYKMKKVSIKCFK